MIALYALAAQVVLFVCWAVYDAVVSRGLVPGQHTASSDIKRWVRESGAHRLLLAAAIVDGALYLLLHLVLQVV